MAHPRYQTRYKLFTVILANSSTVLLLSDVFLYFSLPPFPPCRLLLFSSGARARVSFLFVSVPFFVHFSILSRRINPIRARQSIKGHTVIHVFAYPRASLSSPISNCNIGNDGSREFDSSTVGIEDAFTGQRSSW